MKLYSSIKPELIKKKLFQGTWFAFTGALVILIAGTTFPRTLLATWGLPLIVVGLGLISIGLLPYKALARLEIKPHQIIIDDDFLTFLQRGKPPLKIPLVNIVKAEYLERKNSYGIMLFFKDSNLFLPYFTEQSYRALKDLLG